MLAKSYSGAVFGVDAYIVEIEVNTSKGDPKILIVGLPDAAVKESKDRVITAIKNSGFKTRLNRTTINLAPADIKKEGPHFDLPIAMGLLAAREEFPAEKLKHIGLIGELALSGEIRPVKGILPIALEMKRVGMKAFIVPEENAREAAVVSGLPVFPVHTLRQAAEFVAGNILIESVSVNNHTLFESMTAYDEDYRDVKGQEYAKRAIEVAVAGGHNLLTIGPPGTGKTMLAKRVASILPGMTLEESLETTKIHSIAGTLPPEQALVVRRPFRSPHHTISDAGLLGGGTHPLPGEVSLSHHGVLFLDELPEFARNVLEVMRQPLEDGKVTIARAAATVTFPSQFMLVAAMNPCPCGYYGDTRRECRCSIGQIQKYRNKISGPLLDRIDIHVEVPSVSYKHLSSDEAGESSGDIRERVMRARQVQHDRFRRRPGVHCNASMKAADVQKFCVLSGQAQAVLKQAVTSLNLSARAYDRILKVARTIADLAGSEHIEQPHIHEAVSYRTLDRQLFE